MEAVNVEFSKVAEHLERLVSELTAVTGGWPEEEWRVRRAAGKWSRIEITGHLIDSARNNTERVVRALGQPTLEWPGYAQESQVTVQQYHEEPPELVLALWAALNRHFAYVLRRVPEEKEATACTIVGWRTLPLSHLAIDYLAHLEHHLRQILEGTGIRITYSGMPYPLGW
jgi:hypothetical protein